MASIKAATLVTLSIIAAVFLAGEAGAAVSDTCAANVIVDPTLSKPDRIMLLNNTLESDGTYANSINSNASDVDPWNAFLRHSDAFWHSGRDSNGEGDPFYPWPHCIYIKLQRKVIPARVAFGPRPLSSCRDHGGYCGASKYELVGSVDPNCDVYDSVFWEILCDDMSGTHFARKTQMKYCTTKTSLRTKFQCLGICVHDTPFRDQNAVSMRAVQFWERIIY